MALIVRPLPAFRTRLLIILGMLLTMPVASAGTIHRQRIEPNVSVSDTAVRVVFPTHPKVEAGLSIENGEIIGLSHVSIDGCDVLAAPSVGLSSPIARRIEAGEIAPIEHLDAYLAERAETGDRHAFPKRGELHTTDIPLRGRLAGWRRDGRAVVLDAALRHGRAEWRLAPARTRTHAGTYVGMSWQLRLYNVGRVYEVEIEEPVVFAEGDWRFQQRGSQTGGRNEEESRLSLRVDPEHSHTMSKRKYNARQQPFFFLAGGRGATLSYLDGISCADVWEAQKRERIALYSTIPVRPDTEGCIATPAKIWVFRRADVSNKWTAINEWTWAWDRVIGDLQAQAGIQPIEPLPTLFHLQFDTPGLEFGMSSALRKTMAPPALEDSWLRHFADEVVPKAAAWGIRAIELRAVLDTDIDHTESEFPAGSFAEDSVCSPWGLRISPKLGGEEGLAYVVQKAHAHGIQVAIWSAPAHQSVCSPVVRAHPEWLMFDLDGRVNNRGYVTLVGMNLAAGFRAYLEDAYKRLRDQTGLDGVWADSYCAFGADRDMSDAAPYPQLQETVSLQRAMQRMGYTLLMKEGCGPFGLSSRSSGLHGVFGREYLRYYFLYNHSDPSLRYDPDSYFRTLASKGVMEIRSPRDFESLPEKIRERMIKANFAYTKALPLMKRRFVLGHGDTWQGVAWMDQQGQMRVLFSFESFDWRVHQGAQGRELMTGEPFRASGGMVPARPWRVYVLDPSAPLHGPRPVLRR